MISVSLPACKKLSVAPARRHAGAIDTQDANARKGEAPSEPRIRWCPGAPRLGGSLALPAKPVRAGFDIQCVNNRIQAAIFILTIIVLALALPSEAAQPKAPPAVVELIEDDSDDLIRQLNNDGGLDATQIRLELRDVYAGMSSIRVTPFQRFSSRLQGWNYPIAERPRAGEYRYIRFAWKRPDGDGVMIQLHANGMWNHRYYAGARSDQTATWGAMKQVDPNVPREWTVVTRDLFADWGAMTITGIALTTMETGTAALFDHIYLGRSIEDLDRASAEAFGKTPLDAPLTLLELGNLWEDLAKVDVKRAGLASRKLTAGRKESVQYMDKILKMKRTDVDLKQVTRWIGALDDEDFQTREAAFKGLSLLGDQAIPHLQEAFGKATSKETRSRLEALLKERGALDGGLTSERLRLLRAARILEWTSTPESLQTLEALEKMPDAAGLPEIKQCRERLARGLKR